MISRGKTAGAVALALVIGAVTGISAGAAKWRRPPSDPFTQKRELILNRAKDMPAGGIVVFGDSIVERQRLDTLCGLPAFNAGIGSARIGDAEPVFRPVEALTRPARYVLAIGANDAFLRPATDPAVFGRKVEAALSELGPRPILVGVTGAPQLNEAIKAAAERHHGTYIEPIPAGLTEDGLHLNRQGLAEWKRRVNAAC